MSTNASPQPAQTRTARSRQWEQELNQLYDGFLKHSRQALAAYDREAVHQARTHCRRLMTLLSVLDPEDRSGLHAEFRKAQKALGKVRDADVFIKELKARRQRAKRTDGKKAVKALKAVAEHEKQHRAKLRRKLGRKLPAAAAGLDKRWSAFIGQDLPGLAEQRNVNVLLRELEVAYEQQKKICKDLFRQENATSREALDALHQLRIAAKKIRYTAGAASFALDRKFQSYEALYRDISDKLGAINDKRVWLERLDEPLRQELDIPRKAWDRLTAGLRSELGEALAGNGIVPIPAAKAPAEI
ncbi:CHAD domain-containing protein [Paenibacillus glufosinatiresistens]|uniref:CHAD domain-containing protein n=1 Tax=Paenibacillus glufosinatiresistens TaxID=3070657 RepID=UPI00286E5075|nr:CHAD domain-containing protein [Paenibacillus sp. YX.27]